MGKGFEYLQTVKGIELPMHDPKFAPGFARTYQFDPTPGRHVKGGSGMPQMNDKTTAKYEYGKSGAKDMVATIGNEVLQVAGACLFYAFTGQRNYPSQALEAVTGWPFDQAAQKETMMRVMNMRHAFNLREGLKPSDFVLPPRSVGEPAQSQGPLSGITIDHKTLARNFFAAMEWDEETGKPSRQSLEALGGMDDVIRDLYGS
jgi:aldehyde:ferredoxin oxidoreductase